MLEPSAQDLVDIAAMARYRNLDLTGGIVHGVDHPVVPGAHPQIRPVPFHLLHSWRPGVISKLIDLLYDGFAGWPVELLQVAECLRVDADVVGAHRLQAQLSPSPVPRYPLVRLVPCGGGVGVGGVGGVLDCLKQ
jgi:hypothetical protein